MSSPLYSSHIFMFPFRFDWNEKGFENEFAFYEKYDIDERNDLPKLHTKLLNSGWEYEKFKIEGKNDYSLYNEYAYFYDYARDAIYNLNNFSKNTISNFYRKQEFDGDKFIIDIKQNKKTYELTIESITLRVFNAGVAILAIELKNDRYSDFSDILKINDFGRRIYPQFIDETGVEITKDQFLANRIKVGDNIEEKFEYEDFHDIRIGQHILSLLGNEVFSQERNSDGAKKKFYIQPILDDRMFVLSWYGNDEKAKAFAATYLSHNDWYQYVFVDNNGATVQDEEMKKSLLKDATYPRWANYNTLWAVTRYSMVLLTDESDFGKEKLRIDLHTMYFQMVTLLLATRASILRFSDEIAAVASKKEIDRLETLYEKYLTFYNRLYFKEVTHQDQGIELYDMARKQMRIDEHIKKLDGKFTKLFEFSNLKAEKEKRRQEEIEEERKEKINEIFNLIGGVFILPSLMIALLSMGIFDYNQSYFSLGIGLLAIVLSGFIGYFALKNLNTYSKRELKDD